MKKIILTVLLCLVCISLFGCGDEETEYFAPVASTSEESQVVMTFTIGEQSYDIKYELYRALFIGNREQVDGGDESVWSGDSANEKINEIDLLIIERAADIYAAIHLAQSLGYDVYSDDADAAVQEHIRLYVYGGESGGVSIQGYGSYDKYLSALKARGMNYSVGELMIRYNYALKKINEYYVGKTDSVLGNIGGKLDTSDSALLEYYNGSDSVRLLEAYFQDGTKTPERIAQIREEFVKAPTLSAVAAKIIQYTASTSSEIIDSSNRPVGKVVGRYELDEFYYSDYTDAAFSIDSGDVSPVIRISGFNDIYSDGYYILVALPKSEEYFNTYKESILLSYISNYIGNRLFEAKDELISGLALAEGYQNIIHSELSK